MSRLIIALLAAFAVGCGGQVGATAVEQCAPYGGVRAEGKESLVCNDGQDFYRYQHGFGEWTWERTNR